MNAIDQLADCFSRLPGIGKKSALRLVNFVLKADPLYVKNFATQLATLQEKIKPCSICGTWTENDPCPICEDNLRDRTIICVVEQPQDVSTIDSSREYNGLFHVLGGVIAPLEGIGPDKLNISSLLQRLKSGMIKEVILATNPTVEGDTTALYLQKIISNAFDIKITRLASGLPVGGDLEYIDKLTLARSFKGRSEF